jgi:ribonuclease Z
MKFFTRVAIFVIALIGFFVFLISNNTAVQDRLMARAINNLMPETFLDKEDSLRAVICGSRSPIASPGRAQACVLVEAGDDIYIIDTGDGSANNLNDFNIPWQNVKGVIFTHLHSDHISDLADVHLLSWVNGRKGKLPVYGPKGVNSVTNGFDLSYSNDYVFRNAHHGETIAPLKNAGYTTNIIDINKPNFINSNELKITAFEVNHDPVEPAFGIRFDYKGRSVVISGDTTYSDNLIKASIEADVLIHEAMSIPLLNAIRTAALNTGRTTTAKILIDVQDYHTPALEVAEVALQANVGHLILYHLLPAPRNNIMEKIFYRGMDDLTKNWTSAVDGTRVTLPINSDEIIIDEI